MALGMADTVMDSFDLAGRWRKNEGLRNTAAGLAESNWGAETWAEAPRPLWRSLAEQEARGRVTGKATS